MDKEKIELSIIIPVHNSERYLERCLTSIASNIYENAEIIIIDDGSTDESYDICNKYVKEDSRFSLFKGQSLGASSARNKGIALAKGKYITFVDSDDIVSKTFITDYIEYISKHEDIELLVSFFYECYEDFESRVEKKYRPGIHQLERYLVDYSKNPIAHYYGVVWNKVYKREILETHRIRFDDGCLLCEDTLFNMKYYKHINTVHVMDSLNYFYLCDRAGSFGKLTADFDQMVERHSNVVSKYFDLWKSIGLYKRYRLLVYLYPIKLYNIKCKEYPQMTKGQNQLLKNELIYKNGISHAEFELYLFARIIKRVIKR